MKLLPIITLLINLCISYEPLLKQITRLYPQNAFLDDINSIAIDQDNHNIYVTNTASGTIDIISYSSIIQGHFEQSLTIIRSIDINLQGSPHFKLDYITSITYTTKGYIVATLIPYNYAKLPGWLVFIDPDTQYIENFIPLKYCYSPKHIVPTSDGKKLVIACEGLADPHVADPAGSISVVNIESNDPSQWKIYNVGFTAYDDCEDSYDEELVMKHLPEGIYLPEPTEVFSINAEPEYITIDDNDRFAYISLQENNGVAILDIEKLEISEIFSFGAHDFSYTGLDPSDKDNGINIMTYNNLYGLRQPDGITFYKGKNGKSYILTANEGNAKYFDTVRVNTVTLDSDSFPNGDILKKDDNLGRLQILNAGEEYGLNQDDEFEKLYAFGSRDWAAWEIEGPMTDDCPCEYPYGLRQVFSSYDDFEQITASELGKDGFNSDFFVSSFDTRSDGKGPEPESITVGQCSNGDVYAFIGLERVGGIMVYDITDLGTDNGEVYYVEYLNTRDFSIEYDDDTRPPEAAGDVEPEQLIFIPDSDDDDTETAYLIVGYKTSASLGVYSFDCGCHRNYKKDNKPDPVIPDKGTADTCDLQSPCINVDIRPIVIGESENDGIILDDEEGKEMYVVCMSFDIHNPYCTKDDDFFAYGVEAGEEYLDDKLVEWYEGEQRCKIAECQDFVRFCIMDGEGCSNSDALATTIDNVDYITCKKSVRESCEWKIPTPICQNIPFTIPDSADGSATTNSPSSRPTDAVITTTKDDGYFNNVDVIYTPDDPNYSAPTDAPKVDYASTCDTQGPCLKLSVTEYNVDNREEYTVCMYWNGELNGCNKRQDTSFFKAAIGIDQSTFRWESGLNHQLCKTVMCGNEASFGLKDESCANSVVFEGIVDDISGVSCSGIDGGYGITDSCQWNIPTPVCQYTVIDDSNVNDPGDGIENNNEKENRSNFDVIINKGGHFYESTMFYILLAIFVITFCGIILNYPCIIMLLLFFNAPIIFALKTPECRDLTSPVFFLRTDGDATIDVNSIAIDDQYNYVYVANAATSTIQIVRWASVIEDTSDDAWNIIASIDINDEYSAFIGSDIDAKDDTTFEISNIISPQTGWIIATLNPFKDAGGWLMRVGVTHDFIDFIRLDECSNPTHIKPTLDANEFVIACDDKSVHVVTMEIPKEFDQVFVGNTICHQIHQKTFYILDQVKYILVDEAKPQIYFGLQYGSVALLHLKSMTIEHHAGYNGLAPNRYGETAGDMIFGHCRQGQSWAFLPNPRFGIQIFGVQAIFENKPGAEPQVFKSFDMKDYFEADEFHPFLNRYRPQSLAFIPDSFNAAYLVINYQSPSGIALVKFNCRCKQDPPKVYDASTCDTQGPCLKLSVTEYNVDNREEYTVCMYWDGELNGCNKRRDTPFFAVATGTYPSEKRFLWRSLSAPQCKTVMCGTEASFGLKDESCANSVVFEGIVDGINGVSCSGTNGGYGLTDSCQWNIPAPACQYTVIDNNKDRITDDPIDDNKEPIADDPIDDNKEPIADDPIDDNKEPIADDPIDDNKEPISDNPIDDNKEPIADDPIDDDKEPIADDPIDDNKEPIADDPIDDNKEPIADDPIDDDKEPIADDPIDDDKEPIADDPIDDDKEPIADDPIDDNKEPITDEPIDQRTILVIAGIAFMIVVVIFHKWCGKFKIN